MKCEKGNTHCMYFKSFSSAMLWSHTLPFPITCGAPALPTPSNDQPTRAATQSVTSGQSMHCGLLPSIWRGMSPWGERDGMEGHELLPGKTWHVRCWHTEGTWWRGLFTRAVTSDLCRDLRTARWKLIPPVQKGNSSGIQRKLLICKGDR